MRLEGRCTCCGKPAAPSLRKNVKNGLSNLCAEHQLARREYMRERAAATRRYLGSASYQAADVHVLSKKAGS
jgi:hypothetical protein